MSGSAIGEGSSAVWQKKYHGSKGVGSCARIYARHLGVRAGEGGPSGELSCDLVYAYVSFFSIYSERGPSDANHISPVLLALATEGHPPPL